MRSPATSASPRRLRPEQPCTPAAAGVPQRARRRRARARRPQARPGHLLHAHPGGAGPARRRPGRHHGRPGGLRQPGLRGRATSTSCAPGPSDIAALDDQVIRPYTDLLLHDMGAGLADGRPDLDGTGATPLEPTADIDPTGQEWRTPPLWGIGLVATVNDHTRFLHDGRARSLEEAILWHGGEAEPARDALPRARRQDRVPSSSRSWRACDRPPRGRRRSLAVVARGHRAARVTTTPRDGCDTTVDVLDDDRRRRHRAGLRGPGRAPSTASATTSTPSAPHPTEAARGGTGQLARGGHRVARTRAVGIGPAMERRLTAADRVPRPARADRRAPGRHRRPSTSPGSVARCRREGHPRPRDRPVRRRRRDPRHTPDGARRCEYVASVTTLAHDAAAEVLDDWTERLPRHLRRRHGRRPAVERRRDRERGDLPAHRGRRPGPPGPHRGRQRPTTCPPTEPTVRPPSTSPSSRRRSTAWSPSSATGSAAPRLLELVAGSLGRHRRRGWTSARSRARDAAMDDAPRLGDRGLRRPRGRRPPPRRRSPRSRCCWPRRSPASSA